MQDRYTELRHHDENNQNKGSTLVEMIVSLTILSIMLSLTVFGLLSWQDWANFKRENEYAQVLYIAASNQMTEFSTNGRLEEMRESLAGASYKEEAVNGGRVYTAVGLNLTDSITAIKNSEGEYYSLSSLFPESSDKTEPDLYQDEIISLRAETGEYQEYLNDPQKFKENNPEAYWVFELLGSYVYDTSILNGSKNDGNGNGAAICVEITPKDGQVLSVLYSDMNDSFIYLGIPGDKNGTREGDRVSDIADRTESYRKERMIGYYGVDTLYTSTKNEMIQPSMSSVKLYNKETFYLTCRLSEKYRTTLTSRLTYVLDLNGSENVNDKVLSITLDGSKLKNELNAEVISCPVSRYDSDGNEILLGEFPILAWVEPDYTIHVVLDAADIQATTDLYQRELDDIRSADKAATTRFSKTYSFFRFGVFADNVYASVTATGDGYTPSKIVSNFGNLNYKKNQGAKHTVFAGENNETDENGTSYTYSVTNARHLYNIRYIEDISYEMEAGSIALSEEINGVTFILKDDIDWRTFEQEGNLFNSYNTTGNIQLSSLNMLINDSEGNAITEVNRYNCDFPSISQLRARDVFDGNGYKITGISVSEISNALYGLYFVENKDELYNNRPTGFVNVNYGEIRDLSLDKLKVSGSRFVGGFCGINAGQAVNLETLNSDRQSLISGKRHVGGIIGFQLPTSENMVIEGLSNRAQVNGVEAVGGIMGMIRNDYAMEDIDFTELTGLTSDIRALLENPSELNILIRDCKNHGAILGVNTSELKGVYTSTVPQTTLATTYVDTVLEPRYIGGIVGYCYNSQETDTTKITIEGCTSAPQYSAREFTAILSDETELNSRLKGVYVGGIVGYNYFGQINNSSTGTELGQEGCLFGYRYVGGIVGFNIGPASGIIGSNTSVQGLNYNHVIAYEYAGGITGCNSNVRNVDSENNTIGNVSDKDPEKLVGLLVPEADRDLNVKIDNWVNKGIVIAVNEYSGGITGYNSGYIYRCNSEVSNIKADFYFQKLYSGDYSGGIAGYNNGIIGNTKREINADGKTSIVLQTGEKFSTVCYVKGHNYVGGIVGYNDVDSIVEDYEVASGYVLGDEGSCFVGGYAGLNASVDLLMNLSGESLEARFIYSNPNHVKGSYFVGGNIGGNLINIADNKTISRIDGIFMTDNFLGILEGKAFVGGFVGYNLLFDNSAGTLLAGQDEEEYRGEVYLIQRELIGAFESSDAAFGSTEEKLSAKKRILDNLSEELDMNIRDTDVEVVISGQGADSTKVSFGTISGEIFIGGVMGYNDSNTHLTIRNVENATPIEALGAIECSEEQPLGRTTDYRGNEKIYLYSYSGGVIGKVNENTVLDNCWNSSTGTVTTAGTYTGGLCEINEGVIKNCTVNNFGSSVDDYVGGLCGLNKSTITSCTLSGRTVSGRNVVGGITTENFGTIADITLSGSKLLIQGITDATGQKDGVGGMYTAYNGDGGTLILSEDITNVWIISDGRYVGAVTGINEGRVINGRNTTPSDINDNILLSGIISGYKTVGGFIGLNSSEASDEIIACYTNRATVIATNGCAGGIIGENRSDNSILFCVNDAIVTASDAGDAGGITSFNRGNIRECYDYEVVSAPKGMCGGITAINEAGGIISNCYVEPETGDDYLTFRSTIAVGAIAAQNSGEIADNSLRKVMVTNETTAMGTSVGIIVGDNLSGGKILLADNRSSSNIDDCVANVQNNYCKVGGIAGTNAGYIMGTVDRSTDTVTSIVSCNIKMDNATIANMGGVAGINTGEISNVSVDAVIHGNLGSSETGYGGIAGCSGYTDKNELARAQSTGNAAEYPAKITNCTFDGIINATGSSGAPVRIGGIVGINGYGSRLMDCYIGVRASGENGNITYITAGDYINKTSESIIKTDTKSYSYLGGIAGENYGYISACDNAEKSTDTVNIIGFAGEAGGIVGYNYAYAKVSGYLDEDGRTEHYLSTGKKWSVEQRCCGNDRGPGGIIGKSVSAEDMSYVINYASVTCNYKSNTYVAGLIGILGQQYDLRTRFYKCENYGNITSFRNAGGLIGMLESNGADFIECNNWGEVYAQTMYCGGLVSLHYSYTVGMDFRHCSNHGRVFGDGDYVGGFVGNEKDNSGTVESYLYDCVNTGIIQRRDGQAVHSNSGVFYGRSSSRVIMELCRNYNTQVSANGFVSNGDARYKNCLDVSGNITNNAKYTPFGGAVGWNTNLYYLDRESYTTFSHKNYGVYFSFHEGPNGDFSYNGLKYRDTFRDPSVLFAEPDKSNRINLYRNDRKYNVRQLNFSLTYDDDSEGIDSFVFYMWNGNDSYNSAPAKSYNVTATYLYSDGTQETVSKQTVTGNYYVVPEARVVFKNPRENDKKPVQIRVAFDNTGDIGIRGISYIPASESQTQREAVCTYLGEQTDTTFNINEISRIKTSGEVLTYTSFSDSWPFKCNLPTDVWYCYPSEVMDIEWTPYSSYRLEYSQGETADISFEVSNGDNATGMDSFVFYLANNNNNPNAQQKDRQTYYYEYSVTFTDKNGRSVTTDTVTDAKGYDSSEADYLAKSRQEVKVPDELDPAITSIQLHIKTTKRTWIDNGNLKEGKTGYIYLRGFKWIPEGQTKEAKMAVGSNAQNSELFDRNRNGELKNTHLKIDNSGATPYIYMPLDYSKGFYMDYSDNNPIAETYYSDKSDYSTSITENKDSGSRIDTYLDLDPKFIRYTEDVCTVYHKLNAPTDLKVTEAEACVKFEWKNVLNAYAYEVAYEIEDVNGQTVYASEVQTVGSFQTNYTIKIDNTWNENGYRLKFRVRAINAYHFVHSDKTSSEYDEYYEKYDSVWSELNQVVKKTLPKPEVHMEVVAGNRMTFVLDNYDEFVEEGCTDCTIVLYYKDSYYNWSLKEDGKYRKPVFVSGSPNGPTVFRYYAEPNDSIKDIYTSSAIHLQRGEGHGNDNLLNGDYYCTTEMYGFYGNIADAMEYRIAFTLNNNDTYLMTDIIAYDSNVGASVVYDSEITHAANSYSGGGQLMLTSTLKNLPEQWFSEDKIPKITVRAYPYHSQFDIIHYGHPVVEGIRLDGTVEENRAILAGIFDEAYFGELSETPERNCIWDFDNNDLKSGYLLQKQEDGSYNIIYSSVIELSQTAAEERRTFYDEPYREYYKYDVYYRIYSDMASETSDSIVVNSSDFQESYWSRGLKDRGTNVENYYNTKTDSSERKYVQEIHSAPIVEDMVITGVDESGHNSYTFKWDTYYQDTACWYQRNNRYEYNRLNSLTNAEATGLIKTWDAYYSKWQKAGLSDNDIATNNKLLSLMNNYYYSYSTANYRVDLIGTTIDGEEVILDTIIVDSPTALGNISSYQDENGVTHDLTARDGATATTYNMWDYECTFVDANNVWGTYPKLTARIMRLGSERSVKIPNTPSNQGGQADKNGATYILPRYTEKSIQVKLKLNTISKPSVSLVKENGVFITNDLVYDIEWGSITDEAQIRDIGGYLITVKLLDPADDNDRTETHYYYVTDISDASDTIGLDLAYLNSRGVVTDVTEYYTKTDNKSKTRINLSDFNTNDVIEISVKAIARANANAYEDGYEGVTTEISIPSRLKVPKTDALIFSPNYNDVAGAASVDMETYMAGISFSYDMSDYTNERTAEITMAIAVYDSKPEGAETDSTLVGSEWNLGAVKTLYTKADAFKLGGVTAGESSLLDLTEFEKYPGEFAGKWLKLSLQATSSTKIDSQWTDQDASGETTNYVWIRIPGITMDDVAMKTYNAMTPEDEISENIVRYYYNGALYNTSQNASLETPIETQLISFVEDRKASGYRITIVCKPEAEGEAKEVYDLYLERHLTLEADETSFDGTWDVFMYEASGTSDIEGDIDSPICKQNQDAVWIGNIGALFDSDTQGENSVVTLIEIPEISCEKTISYTTYTTTAQLRYVEAEETGAGSFIILLPDITMIGENPNNVNEDYCVEQVLVQQYLQENTPYSRGKAALFGRKLDSTDGKWKTEVMKLDIPEIDIWYEGLLDLDE